MTEKTKIRADELVLAQKLAPTLKEAQALIMAGMVVAGEQRVQKPSQILALGTCLRLKERRQFVSRGGDKLQGAITLLGLAEDFRGKVALDIGASTGGFTHCLLELGAQQVLALDVGRHQLAWSLRQDARVVCLEGTHIKDFDPRPFPPLDWVVADVSFNSLARLATPIAQLGSPSCRFLIMVKPQFELAASQVPRGGVVHDAELRQQAVDKVSQSFTAAGLVLYTWVDSPLKGRKGNQEIFLYLGKSGGPQSSGG